MAKETKLSGEIKFHKRTVKSFEDQLTRLQNELELAEAEIKVKVDARNLIREEIKRLEKDLKETQEVVEKLEG